MTDWLGEGGTLKKLVTQYRGMAVPGTPMYGKGVVKGKHVEGGENLVDCEIWLEDHEGKKTTLGSAIAVLPSRS